MSNILSDEPTEDRERALQQAAVEFGRKVKQLRKAAGLTQQELADRISQGWGRTYHQSTVAKMESGARMTYLSELIPLSVALGVPQREFFEDPSPAERAEREVRQAEQELLRLRAEIDKVREHYGRLRDELQKAEKAYSAKVQALEEVDPDAVAERRQDAEELKDLAETWREDRWPV